MAPPTASGGAFVLPRPGDLLLGGRRFDLSRRALVMGILNRTPDSFFDAGRDFALDTALRRAADIAAAGADIIDIGGVKAGVGEAVSLDEELDRVVPVVEALSSRIDVALSVDTWNAEVAAACFAAGAVLGNDISGFSDPGYLEAAARAGAGVVATHIRTRPRVLDPNPTYPDDDVIGAVESALVDLKARALRAGIPAQSIVVDCGLDLGKSTPQSLALLRASDRFSALGPLMLAASNKDFLGELFALSVGERRDATLAACAVGVVLGCRVLRVHDVGGTRAVVDTLEALL